MVRHGATPASATQASARAAHRRYQQRTTVIAPVLLTLDRHLKRRLACTFLATLIAIVQWCTRPIGVLLSEPGA